MEVEWGRGKKRLRVDMKLESYSQNLIGRTQDPLPSAVGINYNVKVLLPEDQEDAQTTNVVYPEVLAEVRD